MHARMRICVVDMIGLSRLEFRYRASDLRALCAPDARCGADSARRCMCVNTAVACWARWMDCCGWIAQCCMCRWLCVTLAVHVCRLRCTVLAVCSRLLDSSHMRVYACMHAHGDVSSPRIARMQVCRDALTPRGVCVGNSSFSCICLLR